MQTFVPYPDSELSASLLDDRRLNKQRVETFQILRAITDDTYGWQNHPAVQMWRGHVGALRVYGLAMCDVWSARGGNDNADLRGRIAAFDSADVSSPAWWGDDRVHASHRGNLIRKDADWYGRFWDDEPCPYFWPLQHSDYDTCYGLIRP